MLIRKTKYILFLLLLSFFFFKEASANPVAVGSPGAMLSVSFFILLPTFLIGAAIEFTVIYFLLKSTVQKISKLFKAVFAVNFVTFPLTQILAYLILASFQDKNHSAMSNYYFYLAEIIPFLGEYFLYKKQFNKLYQSNYLIAPVEKSAVIIITITSNLVSFLFGLLLPTFIYYLLKGIAIFFT